MPAGSVHLRLADAVLEGWEDVPGSDPDTGIEVSAAGTAAAQRSVARWTTRLLSFDRALGERVAARHGPRRSSTDSVRAAAVHGPGVLMPSGTIGYALTHPIPPSPWLVAAVGDALASLPGVFFEHPRSGLGDLPDINLDTGRATGSTDGYAPARATRTWLEAATSSAHVATVRVLPGERVQEGCRAVPQLRRPGAGVRIDAAPSRGATMFSTVVLPLDDSPEGHRAIRPAAVVADRFGADIQVINAIPNLLGPTAPATAAALKQALEERGVTGAVDVLADEDVPGVVARWVSTQDEPLAAMATTSGGRARDVVVGSTAERLVHQLAAPILLVGPEVDEGGPIFGGPVVIAVGTEALRPETVALVRAWVDAVDAVAWVVTVVDPSTTDDGGSGPSSTVERHAEVLGRDMQWEVLHGDDPATKLASFAEQMEAGSIITTTHGRVGFERLVTGSTSFAIAHQARCPVLVHQPFAVVAHEEAWPSA